MATSDESQVTLRRSRRTLPLSQEAVKRQSVWGMSSTRRLLSTLKIESLLKTWDTISNINYFAATENERSSQQDKVEVTESFLCRRSVAFPPVDQSLQCFLPPDSPDKDTEERVEKFITRVTSLMNEEQLWGCFYNFPELYADACSPAVRVRRLAEVPELVNGVLTREMIAACLTYLRRTPILGDYVFIKLDLSSKHLVNIDVLQDYRYLTYLDLSSNYLTELSVLSYLLYLQFISVAFNRLTTVLEYDVPQWFLTEVHYKFNSVKRIRDITMFWSITVLDLSHNNIKCISGLEHLHYLRRLDLSFNHIQRLENLNHLRLLWLDVSYNNISSFEFGSSTGLWTLYHLEFLNLNENNLQSMKIFSGCSRLQELHARNNRLSMLLELAVYMRQLRRLVILDLRANPICTTPGYQEVIINTFPKLLSLDAEEINPIEQRTLKMNVTPNVCGFASRRLLRLLYIEQLSRARVSPFIPPADTTEVPIVCLVGYEAVGKGTLGRRLAKECSEHIELALQTTTSTVHLPGHYKEVTRSRFDDMLLAGDLMTYCEIEGESYGLTREEAYIRDSKVRVACLDLPSALMLNQRGRRPYLILCNCEDKQAMKIRQLERKELRTRSLEGRTSIDVTIEKSTLQILVSGRILVTGILNEILLTLPEDKGQSEFIMESECSLLMDSEARQAVQEYARGVNMLNLMCSSTASLEQACNIATQKNDNLNSLYSLYKDSQETDEYASDLGNSEVSNSKRSADHRHSTRMAPQLLQQDKLSELKSMDFSKDTRGMSGANSAKSSKSVTFTSQDAVPGGKDGDMHEHKTQESTARLTGLIVEPRPSADTKCFSKNFPRSVSNKFPWPRGFAGLGRSASGGSIDDGDLWLTFLVETGLLQASDPMADTSDIQTSPRYDMVKTDDPEYMLKLMNIYRSIPGVTSHFTTHSTRSVRDNYEVIHQNYPGLFHDTISMDNPEKAFKKAKRIIREIVQNQKHLKPMFDIDFAEMPDRYPIIEQKLKQLTSEIAPKRFFF